MSDSEIDHNQRKITDYYKSTKPQVVNYSSSIKYVINSILYVLFSVCCLAMTFSIIYLDYYVKYYTNLNNNDYYDIINQNDMRKLFIRSFELTMFTGIGLIITNIFL
jgi:hypothetical protein